MRHPAPTIGWIALALSIHAQDIGFIETFSLAPDREASLRELVPGTDDFFYFHALHAQNTGARERFQQTLDRWIRERNGNVHPRASELLNRQALLDYETNPRVTLDYLKRELNLRFNHARKTGERRSDAPTVLDNRRIGIPALLQRALEEQRNLGRLEDPGLALAADQRLSPDQRRNLLSRLSRPDFPGVVDLIAADLEPRDSRGFGSLSIHGRLTVEQLEELLRKRPSLRNETAFVNVLLGKLAPRDEIDLDTDVTEREAYHDRVWTFVRTLDPAHNSLKANVLYNRLRHDETQGVHDRERFLEYLRLPRNVRHLRPEFREQVPNPNQIAQLGQDFQLIGLPPVPVDEPLVRRFLLEFFREDEGVQAFAPYLRDVFLRPVFAEAKIVNGIGDPEQWASLLTPEEYRRIKERVDLDFTPSNPVRFGPDEEVQLTVFVKNVASLRVNLYEINTFNYYRETGQPLNLALNLDGLVASVSRTFSYDAPPERRIARTFDLPELTGRGAYVVELIGNGKSSRALVQKGQLNVVQQTSSAGHAFTVLDENGHLVPDAVGWLGGRDFPARPDGRILVPFTAEPREERIVLRQGDFATLARFTHRSEGYTLHAGVYVDREALIRRERATLLLRPVLRVSGQPASLTLLEEPRLRILTTDLQGIVTEKVVQDLDLRDDAEYTQDLQVPENIVSLHVTLEGRVRNLSQGRRDDLKDGASFAINRIELTLETQMLHVGRNASGYYVDARGKNGEPLAGEPLACFFKHRLFRDEVQVALQTDARGRAMLGALEDIERFRIKAPGGRELRWIPTRDACAYPESLHGIAGEPLRIPLLPGSREWSTAPSLIETRREQFVRDWRATVNEVPGFLEIRGLPAGDYSLFLGEQSHTLVIRITEGEVLGGFARSPRRVLELPRLDPLHIVSLDADEDSVVLHLANATPFARVHLFATRYLPEFDLFDRLGHSGFPDLQFQPFRPDRTFYESGRDIGDEYRYILDRQHAAQYPGSLLERPGLLLNPWAVRTTEAEEERLAEGSAYAGSPVVMRGLFGSRTVGGMGAAMDPFGGADEGFASLDFLRQPAISLTNLVPDDDGRVVVPRALLKGLPYLRALAVDPSTTVLRSLTLDDTPVERRELRLAEGLDPGKRYAEQKRITPLVPRDSISVSDVTTARFETYDTVAKLYRLLATLSEDETLAEFSFVATWPSLKAAEQLRLYSQYACHELNFFLYHKDRAFFDSVIAPYLANKKDKTFLDSWLLGGDLAGYLEPWRFGRLNAVERVLLGQRIREQEAAVARDARERAELIPPDPEAFNRRFDTAVQIGSLETVDDGTAAGEIATVRQEEAQRAGERLLRAAGAPPEPPRPAAASPAPAAMAMADAQPLRRSAARVAQAPAEDLPDREFFTEKERDAIRPFFQKLEKTREWAENNYWHQPIEQHVAERVKVNAFWIDYAAHDHQRPFLSESILETATNFTEMMLALAVLELPFEAPAHGESLEGLRYTLRADSPALLFHREIREAEPEEPTGGVLVAQQFFRADDRYRIENGERFDKLVTDEFLPQVPYGAQIVLTNPTGTRQKLQALLQIPMGAVPLKSTSYTRGVHVVLEPYSTQTQEYFFYFPETGRYAHYPVTVASHDKVVGQAEPALFQVVGQLTRVDTTSWPWISQNGSEEDVLAFLDATNLPRIEGQLAEIAWRMRDKAFFAKTMALLESRRLFDSTLWSYGILHNDAGAIREFLRHHEFANRCGLWLVSPLLTLDPVERFDYQHLEYAPLVNPRAHAVGARRTILNTRFREQYQRLMTVLSYKPGPDAADTLAVAYYLMLQDRVEEAIAWFGRVDRSAIREHLQSDYLHAYLALRQGDTDSARTLAMRHREEPVERWRNRFTQVLGLLEAIEGGPLAGTADPEQRDAALAALAATAPVLELQVEAGTIRLDSRNVTSVTLNFYPMDIELLFSRSPFLQDGAAHFSFIRPLLSQEIPLDRDGETTTVEIPEEFSTRNVMVEALADGIRRTQAYYAHSLRIQWIETYGQLVVTQAGSGRPLPGTYVKVYARRRGGSVGFFKDGYTDLLGRFDYASLNTNELEDTERMALLVLSPEFGAVVREVDPPKR